MLLSLPEYLQYIIRDIVNSLQYTLNACKCPYLPPVWCDNIRILIKHLQAHFGAFLAVVFPDLLTDSHTVRPPGLWSDLQAI